MGLTIVEVTRIDDSVSYRVIDDSVADSAVALCVHSYMPQREKEHLTPATQILEKRRELEEVEKARKAEKEVS